MSREIFYKCGEMGKWIGPWFGIYFSEFFKPEVLYPYDTHPAEPAHWRTTAFPTS